jgi:uncharacterized DUF497 family protein
MLKVEWDDEKAENNERKHGVSFVEAATIFNSLYLEMKDDSYDEERFKAIGFSLKLNVLLVVYCYRDGDSIRVISARKATKKERKEYEKAKI